MELDKQIKLKILELASEDSYGSWELWGAVNQHTSGMNVEDEVLREQFLSIVETLVREKKLVAELHKFKESYDPAEFNRSRLEFEMDNAGKPEPDSFYWFYATEEGKKEDVTLRSKKD